MKCLASNLGLYLYIRFVILKEALPVFEVNSSEDSVELKSWETTTILLDDNNLKLKPKSMSNGYETVYKSIGKPDLKTRVMVPRRICMNTLYVRGRDKR